MKTKWLYPLLGLEGALCAVLAVSCAFCGDPAAGQSVLVVSAFPLAQLGAGLRALSLSGSAGNLAACLLYSLVCLLPLAAALFQWRRGGWGQESWLLVLLSGLLFPVLYGMVNPGFLPRWFAKQLPLAWGQAACCVAVWVCLLTWAVLRILRSLPTASTACLQKGLCLLLAAVSLLLIAQVFGAELYGLLQSFQELKQSNTALTDQALLPTRLFLCLKYAVDTLPSLLLIGVIRRMLMLLEVSKTDRYCETALQLAHRLARFCQRTAALSVLGWLTFSLAQLIAAPMLYHLNVVLNFPVYSLLLTLGALLWARWMAEGKALKDENEGFI